MSATMPAVSPEKTKTNPLGAGRNPRAGKPAVARVVVRLTDAELVAYQAAAKRDDLSLAVWIRAACEARLPKAKPPRKG